MPRYKLIVEYDGTPYSGWQHQADRHTVQQAIEQALFRFCGERRRLSTAGRTDAGVHAMRQVAHVDLDKAWRTDVVRDALNAHLNQADEAVAILSVELVPESFNARLSARRRHYLYRIADRRPPLTFDRLRAWHVPRSLDVAAMHAAAQLLVGHHDFTSFRASDCQGRTPMKTLERLDVSRNGAEVELHAAARSFLHHQVRFMVGTLAQVGLGRWPVEAVGAVLAARDLQRAGPMAPAHGLYFIGVDY